MKPGTDSGQRSTRAAASAGGVAARSRRVDCPSAAAAAPALSLRPDRRVGAEHLPHALVLRLDLLKRPRQLRHARPLPLQLLELALETLGPRRLRQPGTARHGDREREQERHARDDEDLQLRVGDHVAARLEVAVRHHDDRQATVLVARPAARPARLQETTSVADCPAMSSKIRSKSSAPKNGISIRPRLPRPRRIRTSVP
jgi:hypothetical protein